MRILAIETSCDETAISIVEAKGDTKKPEFFVLADIVLSQIKIHEKYGGVFPHLAKREHSKNFVPILERAIHEAKLEILENKKIDSAFHEQIKYILSREPELYAQLIPFAESIKRPDIDLVAVTYGPGLEPALWVGINAAQALGLLWNIPVLPVNHMEGHISSVLLDLKKPVEFPALALLISGGHTELVLVEDWLKYKIIGETRDDAVGEAFDKVARMLGLPYPGGPEISRLAEKVRESGKEKVFFKFPRPMINTSDFDFSFSGLKTSVLYTIKKIGNLDNQTKKEIAYAFEEAVIEVLVSKTKRAIEANGVKTLIVAGGVVANSAVRVAMKKLVNSLPETYLLIPKHHLSTDNALMIAMSAYIRSFKQTPRHHEIKAHGGARLS